MPNHELFVQNVYKEQLHVGKTDQDLEELAKKIEKDHGRGNPFLKTIKKIPNKSENASSNCEAIKKSVTLSICDKIDPVKQITDKENFDDVQIIKVVKPLKIDESKVVILDNQINLHTLNSRNDLQCENKYLKVDKSEAIPMQEVLIKDCSNKTSHLETISNLINKIKEPSEHIVMCSKTIIDLTIDTTNEIKSDMIKKEPPDNLEYSLGAVAKSIDEATVEKLDIKEEPIGQLTTGLEKMVKSIDKLNEIKHNISGFKTNEMIKEEPTKHLTKGLETMVNSLEKTNKLKSNVKEEPLEQLEISLRAKVNPLHKNVKADAQISGFKKSNCFEKNDLILKENIGNCDCQLSLDEIEHKICELTQNILMKPFSVNSSKQNQAQINIKDSEILTCHDPKQKENTILSKFQTNPIKKLASKAFTEIKETKEISVASGNNNSSSNRTSKEFHSDKSCENIDCNNSSSSEATSVRHVNKVTKKSSTYTASDLKRKRENDEISTEEESLSKTIALKIKKTLLQINKTSFGNSKRNEIDSPESKIPKIEITENTSQENVKANNNESKSDYNNSPNLITKNLNSIEKCDPGSIKKNPSNIFEKIYIKTNTENAENVTKTATALEIETGHKKCDPGSIKKDPSNIFEKIYIKTNTEIAENTTKTATALNIETGHKENHGDHIRNAIIVEKGTNFVPKKLSRNTSARLQDSSAKKTIDLYITDQYPENKTHDTYQIGEMSSSIVNKNSKLDNGKDTQNVNKQSILLEVSKNKSAKCDQGKSNCKKRKNSEDKSEIESKRKKAKIDESEKGILRMPKSIKISSKISPVKHLENSKSPKIKTKPKSKNISPKNKTESHENKQKKSSTNIIREKMPENHISIENDQCNKQPKVASKVVKVVKPIEKQGSKQKIIERSKSVDRSKKAKIKKDDSISEKERNIHKSSKDKGNKISKKKYENSTTLQKDGSSRKIEKVSDNKISRESSKILNKSKIASKNSDKNTFEENNSETTKLSLLEKCLHLEAFLEQKNNNSKQDQKEIEKENSEQSKDFPRVINVFENKPEINILKNPKRKNEDKNTEILDSLDVKKKQKSPKTASKVEKLKSCENKKIIKNPHEKPIGKDIITILDENCYETASPIENIPKSKNISKVKPVGTNFGVLENMKSHNKESTITKTLENEKESIEKTKYQNCNKRKNKDGQDILEMKEKTKNIENLSETKKNLKTEIGKENKNCRKEQHSVENRDSKSAEEIVERKKSYFQDSTVTKQSSSNLGLSMNPDVDPIAKKLKFDLSLKTLSELQIQQDEDKGILMKLLKNLFLTLCNHDLKQAPQEVREAMATYFYERTEKDLIYLKQEIENKFPTQTPVQNSLLTESSNSSSKPEIGCENSKKHFLYQKIDPDSSFPKNELENRCPDLIAQDPLPTCSSTNRLETNFECEKLLLNQKTEPDSSSAKNELENECPKPISQGPLPTCSSLETNFECDKNKEEIDFLPSATPKNDPSLQMSPTLTCQVSPSANFEVQQDFQTENNINEVFKIPTIVSFNNSPEIQSPETFEEKNEFCSSLNEDVSPTKPHVQINYPIGPNQESDLLATSYTSAPQNVRQNSENNIIHGSYQFIQFPPNSFYNPMHPISNYRFPPLTPTHEARVKEYNLLIQNSMRNSALAMSNEPLHHSQLNNMQFLPTPPNSFPGPDFIPEYFGS